MSNSENGPGRNDGFSPAAHTLRFYGSVAATAGFSNALLYSMIITGRLDAVFPFWHDRLFYTLYILIVGTGAAVVAGSMAGALWIPVRFFQSKRLKKVPVSGWKGFIGAVFTVNLLSLSTQTAFWLIKYFHRDLSTGFWISLAVAVFIIAIILMLALRLPWKLRPLGGRSLIVAIAASIVVGYCAQTFYVKRELYEPLASRDDSSYYAKKLEYKRSFFKVRPKNVILIILDALRADHLSLYGYPKPTSPFLDTLGRRGVVFRNVYCQWNYTRVSMPSMFTSIYPRISGIVEPIDFEKKKPIAYSLTRNIQYPYLTEILAKEGYHTAMLLQAVWLPH